MIAGMIGYLAYQAGNGYAFIFCMVVAVFIVVGLFMLMRSKNSISSRNIADISAEIGYDARDLRVAGYSWKEIEGVVNGEYSMETLLARGPAAKRENR